MNVSGILFSPNGRIGPNDFWRGIILLVGFMIVSNVVQFVAPVAISQAFNLVGNLLPYPYLCVYGKRLHDSGRSAWWFLVILFAFIVVMTMALMLLPGWDDIMDAMADPNVVSDQRAMNELALEMFSSPRAAIQWYGALFGFNLAAGWIVARLPSDPDVNQYGLPTRNAGAPFT
ncbi:MAG: DUF805 domain-containing protein [Pseudomonadota bacterium]